jgi:hypothetical protein
MSGGLVRDLIPFVHIADVQRSIAFYELLGFELKDTHEQGSWMRAVTSSPTRRVNPCGAKRSGRRLGA